MKDNKVKCPHCVVIDMSWITGDPQGGTDIYVCFHCRRRYLKRDGKLTKLDMPPGEVPNDKPVEST